MAKRTASARKQMRADVDRAARNRSARSAIKTRVVRVRRAVADHLEEAAELGVAAIASLDRAANKGILHANNAARRKSRLMKALNAAQAGTGEAAAKPAAKAAAKKPAAGAGKPAAKAAAAKATPAARSGARNAPAKKATAKKAPAKKAAARPAAKKK